MDNIFSISITMSYLDNIMYSIGKNNRLNVDNIFSMDLKYPGNLGILNDKLNINGNYFNTIIINDTPIPPGVTILCKIIGIIRNKTNTLISVPISKIDPTYSNWNELDDIPTKELDNLYNFYEHIKGDYLIEFSSKEQALDFINTNTLEELF